MLSIPVHAHDDGVNEASREPKTGPHGPTDPELLLETEPAHAERREHVRRLVIRTIVDDEDGHIRTTLAQLAHDTRQVRGFVARWDQDENVGAGHDEALMLYAGRAGRRRRRRHVHTPIAIPHAT